MRILNGLIALLATFFMAVEPCLASEQGATSGQRPASGAFAGAYVRIPFSNSPNSSGKTRAGLKFGLSQAYRTGDASSGMRPVSVEYLDVAMLFSGRPSVTLLGRQMIDRNGRLSLEGEEDEDGGVSPWLIAGGVVVLGLGIGAYVIADRLKCRDSDDEC